MLAPQATIKRKKGSPQVKGEFCPFTLKIKVATLEQAAALRAIDGAMSWSVAESIAGGVLYYSTTAKDVANASSALGAIHSELIKQGVPRG